MSNVLLSKGKKMPTQPLTASAKHLNLGFSECTLNVHLEHLNQLKLIYSERDKSADDGSVQRSAGGSSWASRPQGVEDRGAHTRLLSSRFFLPRPEFQEPFTSATIGNLCGQPAPSLTNLILPELEAK